MLSYYTQDMNDIQKTNCKHISLCFWHTIEFLFLSKVYGWNFHSVDKVDAAPLP